MDWSDTNNTSGPTAEKTPNTTASSNAATAVGPDNGESPQARLETWAWFRSGATGGIAPQQPTADRQDGPGFVHAAIVVGWW